MKQKLRPLEVFMNLLFFVCGSLSVNTAIYSVNVIWHR